VRGEYRRRWGGDISQEVRGNILKIEEKISTEVIGKHRRS